MSYAKQRGHSRFHINAWELGGRKKRGEGDSNYTSVPKPCT